MSLRKKAKQWKGVFKEAFHKGSGAVQSTGSLSGPSVVIPSNTPIPPQSQSQTASATANNWTSLKKFIRVLDESANVFGPLKLVMDELLYCFETHENAVSSRSEYNELRRYLQVLFEDIGDFFTGNAPPTMTIAIENLCNALKKEIGYILLKGNPNAGTRLSEAINNLDNILKSYKRIQSHLERLKLNADLNIWAIVDEQATEARLDRIRPSLSACYNSAAAAVVRRRACTPKTREQVMVDLQLWQKDESAETICWMSGMAGTGKTTIANTFCVALDETHELAASFFATRLLPECRDIKLIVPTIAYQLARFSRPFRSALSRVLERDPDAHTRALKSQFESMVVKPLRDVTETLPSGIVVVIDALDECDDVDGVVQILEVFLLCSSELPIKIFVSSRPEPQIRRKLCDLQCQLLLHELDDKIVKEDITTYLRTELAQMSLPEDQLLALADHAGTLFIYAATVVRYVDLENPSVDSEERLEIVLKTSTTAASSKHKEIDKLYTIILASALHQPDIEAWEQARVKLVLDTVICAQEPLTVDALSGLLNLGNANRVRMALEPLWSVLHISSSNGLVSTLHASFPDFMFNPVRSKSYHCDLEAHNGRLAELCFERIKRNERQFNICGLVSSYTFDEHIPDLLGKVEQTIPLELCYAAQHWAVHLEQGGKSDTRANFLLEFLSQRLLLWMEILNLKKQISTAVISLEQAKQWCTHTSCPHIIKELVHDAWRFVMMFATNPVSRCTPHIYVSMLASWPSSNPVATRYIQRTSGLVRLEGEGMERRQVTLLGSFLTRSMVYSVGFSPDGKHVVSGSDDHAVRVWNAQSGAMVLGPLEAHTSTVVSVVFSSDGKLIASGSRDNAICVWDARRGKPLLGPLNGHTDAVTSIAFSPDGTRVASGSEDETIHVWDVQSGNSIFGALGGHSNAIMSVAFSPDGLSIVSGSCDSTIMLWDAQNGLPIMGPLEGHLEPAWIGSVAFSPDSARIVSGSHDSTVQVWDKMTGQVILGPLEGHTDSIASVAFSPDGSRIVSGSHDNTIRIWDAQTGEMVLGPLLGHVDAVMSVSFSPDSTRIVSGSLDQTIRMWDAQTEQTFIDPLKGHTNRVHSVTFSPNGEHIVSGSHDLTVRVWNAQSGKPVIGPLKGHTDTVRSVRVSPDNTCIVSGSADGTLRVWDALSGQLVLGPLEGHTSWVTAIAFWTNGKYIVSGSDDHSLRVWDLQSGTTVLGPLEGHTKPITTVELSPNQQSIISGSYDNTIRIWDARTGETLLGPLERLGTLTIRSIAFSPDGARFAYGSDDNAV
ncbi:WD40-repeat-containing domain protein [Rhizoctonia solani]|nr:WD40-repeat-containing domain protein [Rhizoctonia solani]